MKLQLMGLIVGLTLGGAALAQSESDPGTQDPSSSSKQTSSTTKQTSSSYSEQSKPAEGKHQLMGKVVETRETALLIQTDNGEVVPIAVSHTTMIQGKPLKKGENINAHLKKEFKEGDQVRTSFDVENKTHNQAKTIDKEQGNQ
ncbi:hypothetical protein JY651_00935 [Pyxidicoccus parkwayensis]|jgi:hypothetical protein|uniref:DUF5666 domain-containing protein n=1 Tax=Pyxidicoccus parkwayensis TaxID=2813578 RepID=A0ABX7NXE4_9BACT|nr:hypothetical protein [Pyxidicoccus parkwaysis]QSQ23582.1 hypothetical protein JY651_00935 [Pyxidicoccus parkwaysis]